MSKNTLTAARLRLVLVTGMFLLIGLGVAGFIYIQGLLATKAEEVSTISKQAADSTNTVENLKLTQDQLSKYTESGTIKRTASIAADSTSYHYQNQIVQEISILASKAHVSVVAYNFSQGSSTGTAAAAPTKVGGLTPTTVSISIKNPVKYSDFMAFVSYIENNITKMQIARISLSHDAQAAGADMITSDALQLEVYIK